MKKKQLKIEDLKVNSFVTGIENEKSNTIKGMIRNDDTNGPQPEICHNTIWPDASYCNPACLTNIQVVC